MRLIFTAANWESNSPFKSVCGIFTRRAISLIGRGNGISLESGRLGFSGFAWGGFAGLAAGESLASGAGVALSWANAPEIQARAPSATQS